MSAELDAFPTLCDDCVTPEEELEIVRLVEDDIRRFWKEKCK